MTLLQRLITYGLATFREFKDSVNLIAINVALADISLLVELHRQWGRIMQHARQYRDLPRSVRQHLQTFHAELLKTTASANSAGCEGVWVKISPRALGNMQKLHNMLIKESTAMSVR